MFVTDWSCSPSLSQSPSYRFLVTNVEEFNDGSGISRGEIQSLLSRSECIRNIDEDTPMEHRTIYRRGHPLDFFTLVSCSKCSTPRITSSHSLCEQSTWTNVVILSLTHRGHTPCRCWWARSRCRLDLRTFRFQPVRLQLSAMVL